MKSQINVLLPVGSAKVFNVVRPKIDRRVGGNSCFLPLKPQTPLSPPRDRVFCCRMQRMEAGGSFCYSLARTTSSM